jgi:hypothetical protein
MIDEKRKIYRAGLADARRAYDIESEKQFLQRLNGIEDVITTLLVLHEMASEDRVDWSSDAIYAEK